MSKSIKFCLFGHVNSSKSTTAGHLAKLLGYVSEHEFDMIRQGCVKDSDMTQLYSRILNCNAEEQVKGQTIEYAILNLKWKDYQLQLIDTPGHKAFIRDLINGISQVEEGSVIGCALLSARDDEFQAGWTGGQTKEDLIIAKSLGIDNLIVLVSKMDTCGYDRKKYDTIVKTATPFIRDVCRFKTYTFLPISGYQGTGLIEGVEGFGTPSFIDTLVSMAQKAQRPIEEREHKRYEAKNLVLNVRVIQCENILSPGYECIIHYMGKEYECTLLKIKGKKFLKKQELGTCMFKCSPNVILDTRYKRVLIRNMTLTIGYGTIEF